MSLILPTRPNGISTCQSFCISIHKPHWLVGISVFGWECILLQFKWKKKVALRHPMISRNSASSMMSSCLSWDALWQSCDLESGPGKSSSSSTSSKVGWDGYLLPLCKFEALAQLAWLFQGILDQNYMFFFFAFFVLWTYHVTTLLSGQLLNIL